MQQNEPQPYGRRQNDYPGPSGEYSVIRVLQSEAARYGAMFVFLLPIAVFIYQIKVDIALIKQNHEAHIERTLEELSEQKTQIIEIQKDQVETDKQMLIILERLAK
jgi:hypothetical protein